MEDLQAGVDQKTVPGKYRQVGREVHGRGQDGVGDQAAEGASPELDRDEESGNEKEDQPVVLHQRREGKGKGGRPVEGRPPPDEGRDAEEKPRPGEETEGDIGVGQAAARPVHGVQE